MKEIFEIIFNLSMFAFVACSMVTIGLGITLSELIEPFKNTKMVVLSLISNFVLVPIFALGMVWAIPVSEGVRIGIILLSLSGGAPFIPMIVAIAKGRIGDAVGLMVLLVIVTIFYMPIVVPILLPGVTVSSWDIAKSLIYSMLIPLLLAIFVKARYSDIAARIQPLFEKLTNIMLFVLIVAMTYLYAKIIISAATALLITLLFFLGAMAIGYFTGGKKSHTRFMLSVGTGLRNPPIAMLVASQYFSSEPLAALVALLNAIIGLGILFPLAKIVANNKAAQ